MNDPGEFEDLEEEAWESFCEERGMSQATSRRLGCA